MTQLLRILKKDVRYLSYEYGLYLLLLGWYAWLETRVWFGSTASLPIGIRDVLAPVLVSIFAIYLIMRLIHSEAIPGDKQFWLTRPYSWMSLLGAKVTFLVLGVSLPMMAFRLFIFRVQGFPLLPGIWQLLWSQLVITAVIALPIAAVAALSSGAVQFVMFALILIPVGSIIYSDSFWLNRWPENTHWLRDTLTAVALCGVAVWVLQSQYRTRKTSFARGFASCALVLAVVVIGYAPWSLAYAMNEWLGTSKPMTETSFPHVVLGPQTKSQPAPPSDVVLWQIPVVVEGIPAGFTVELQPVLVTLQGAGKMKWQWFSAGTALTTAAEGTYWATGAVERSYFDIARGSAVTVRVMVDLALFPPVSTRTIHLLKDFASVPSGLQCRGIPVEEWFARVYPQRTFEGAECRSPFGWPDLRAGFTTTEGKPLGPKTLVPPDPSTYANPFSLSSVQSNVTYFQYSGPEDVILTIKGPPQRLHQEFEFRDVRLDEFLEPR
jgi:hypothetical protein